LGTSFPARESFVSDIPAGDGKLLNLYLQCIEVEDARGFHASVAALRSVLDRRSICTFLVCSRSSNEPGGEGPKGAANSPGPAICMHSGPVNNQISHSG